MTRDSFHPAPEKQNIVLIDIATMHQAERLIEGCEGCSPLAELPFDSILDCVNASDSVVTDYLLERPARCPNCVGEIREKTLVLTNLMLVDGDLK